MEGNKPAENNAQKLVPDLSLNIQAVADAFGIPKSTLRFWEDEGLLRVRRNDQNDYRVYDGLSLGDLSFLLLLRNTGIPLKEMKNVRRTGEAEIMELLDQCNHALESQIAALLRQQANLLQLQKNLLTIRKLRQQPYIWSEPPFARIVGLELDDPANWMRIVEDGGHYAYLLDSDDPELNLAGVASSTIEGHLIWEKAEHPQAKYLSCLAPVEFAEAYAFDFSRQIEDVRRMGHKPGRILLLYLMTLTSDDPFEYYQMWIEVEQKNQAPGNGK